MGLEISPHIRHSYITRSESLFTRLHSKTHAKSLSSNTDDCFLISVFMNPYHPSDNNPRLLQSLFSLYCHSLFFYLLRFFLHKEQVSTSTNYSFAAKPLAFARNPVWNDFSGTPRILWPGRLLFCVVYVCYQNRHNDSENHQNNRQQFIVTHKAIPRFPVLPVSQRDSPSAKKD